jgi:xanthine dehydrogenase accessory factor
VVIEALDAARRLVADGRRGVLVTAVAGPHVGRATLIDDEGQRSVGPDLPETVVSAAASVARSGLPDLIVDEGSTWFVEAVAPPPRLIVLGAISVTDALVPMAIALGCAVTVIDARPWLAVPERYPGADVKCGTPLELFEELDVDAATSVVSFLHDPAADATVLALALQGPARYVGSMGSRTTSQAKRDLLDEMGLTSADIDRLRAPIGIDVGARSPAEIAVSILAELVAVGRGAR